MYCPDLGSRFTKYANPKVGYVVIFGRSGTFAHTGIVTAVSGDRFETIEGNTSGLFSLGKRGRDVEFNIFITPAYAGAFFML